jgi:superfamily II RNA helicase
MFYEKDFQEETYWMIQHKEEIRRLENELRTKKQGLPTFSESMIQDLNQRDMLETSIQTSVNAEKRKFQSQLETWKNKHVSKVWDDSWKEFKKAKKLYEEIERLELKLEDAAIINKDIVTRKLLLDQFKYIENDTLTQKGVLASQIHEGHPLLMSHVFVEKWWHEKPVNELVCYLSMFLEEPEEFELTNKSAQLRNYQLELVRSERLQSTDSYWNVTEYWFDVVYEWMNGSDYVCEQIGIEYGNFVRAILKLSNIVDEWVNMAIITQDVDMIEKCKDIRSKIVRSFVVPDSLYLRI